MTESSKTIETPNPWKWEMQMQAAKHGGRKLGVLLTDSNNRRIGWVSVTDDEPEYSASEKAAEFIVRACNSHEALLEALDAYLEWQNAPINNNEGSAPVTEKVISALAISRGEQ